MKGLKDQDFRDGFIMGAFITILIMVLAIIWLPRWMPASLLHCLVHVRPIEDAK